MFDKLLKNENKFFLILFFLVVFIVVFVRVRYLSLPLERDEGEYAYIAQLVLQGVRPYTMAYTMKFPGTPLMYAITMLLFGETVSAIHLGLLIVNVCTVFGVVLLTWLWSSEWKMGLLAGSLYALLSLSWAVMGIAAHATHYVVFFAIWGIVLFEFSAKHHKLPFMFFFAGVMLGLAVLMKQPGVFFLVYTVYSALNQHTKISAVWYVIALVVAGFCVPFLFFFMWLLFGNSISQFWLWCIQYGVMYSSQIPLSEAPSVFLDALKNVTRDTIEWWILFGIGLGVLLRKWKSKHYSSTMFIFFLCSFLATSVGFYYRQHYFVLLLPAVSIVAAVGVVESIERIGCACASFARIAVLLILIAYTVGNNSYYYFRAKPYELLSRMYGNNPFDSMEYVAAIIKNMTQPSDRIQVFGSEPEVYFYSQRKSASGYIYMYSMTESKSKFASMMQKQFINEIELNTPKVIVFCMFPFSWLVEDERTVQTLFYWMNTYLQQYLPFLVVEYNDKGERIVYEGNLVLKGLYSEYPKIVVYKRR